MTLFCPIQMLPTVHQQWQRNQQHCFRKRWLCNLLQQQQRRKVIKRTTHLTSQCHLQTSGETWSMFTIHNTLEPGRRGLWSLFTIHNTTHLNQGGLRTLWAPPIFWEKFHSNNGNAHWAEMDLAVFWNFYLLRTVIVVKLSEGDSGKTLCS